MAHNSLAIPMHPQCNLLWQTNLGAVALVVSTWCSLLGVVILLLRLINRWGHRQVYDATWALLRWREAIFLHVTVNREHDHIKNLSKGTALVVELIFMM